MALGVGAPQREPRGAAGARGARRFRPLCSEAASGAGARASARDQRPAHGLRRRAAAHGAQDAASRCETLAMARDLPVRLRLADRLSRSGRSRCARDDDVARRAGGGAALRHRRRAVARPLDDAALLPLRVRLGQLLPELRRGRLARGDPSAVRTLGDRGVVGDAGCSTRGSSRSPRKRARLRSACTTSGSSRSGGRS